LTVAQNNLLGDVAEVGDLRLNTPVPLVLEEKRVVVEETALVSLTVLIVPTGESVRGQTYPE
jgi:hypothetical protein